MPFLSIFSKEFSFSIGKMHLAVPYVQAIAIVLLLFLLVILMAQFRRHMVDWSMKGAVFGIFFGFLLALILEGFLIVGGKTALTGALGWKNPPKPLANVLDLGREKLIKVLGISTEIPESMAQSPANAKEVINFFQSLSPSEVRKAKQIICQ